MLKREAHAIWNGTGKEGKGVLTTQSGTLKDTQYSFHTRFEDGKGTNPEELIAAAHAGCFDMALSFMLTGAGFPPQELNTKATVIMEQEGVHWTVTEIKLSLIGRVPNRAVRYRSCLRRKSPWTRSWHETTKNPVP